MSNTGNNIPSSKIDDELLTLVTSNVFADIKDKYICLIPDTWNLECGTKKVTYKDINRLMIENGISVSKSKMYYGENSSIDTDAHIISLTINSDGKTMYKPLFMGEMKKQGTNDKRIKEGKKKQSQGNAAGDRVAKNYAISADFCYLCDKGFFPYNVFMYGCDFREDEITTTTKAKLQPFFGELNKLNPYFDTEIFWARKGGSCFIQGNIYTYEQLYNICYKCCELGIKYYISKYQEI